MVALGTAAPVESVTFPTSTLSSAWPNRTADNTVSAAIVTQIVLLRINTPVDVLVTEKDTPSTWWTKTLVNEES